MWGYTVRHLQLQQITLDLQYICRNLVIYRCIQLHMYYTVEIQKYRDIEIQKPTDLHQNQRPFQIATLETYKYREIRYTIHIQRARLESQQREMYSMYVQIFRHMYIRVDRCRELEKKFLPVSRIQGMCTTSCSSFSEILSVRDICFIGD